MQIAKIDFKSPSAPAEFVKSLKETGFAVITNHPVSYDNLIQTYRDWERFFRSKEKNEFLFNPKDQSGYFPFKSENAKDSPAKDLKEFYHLYRPQDLPYTIPTDATILVRDQLVNVASTLLHWVDDHSPYPVTKGFSEPLTRMISGSNQTLFRILHYPPIQGEVEEGAVRAAAHEDINLLTILPAATQSGLQVQDTEGNWVDVECDPGGLIVNVGDMLQLASGGYFKSTTHRVVNPIGEEALKSRYSMPLFLHPRPEVFLSPSKTAQQYLNERLRELGLIK